MWFTSAMALHRVHLSKVSILLAAILLLVANPCIFEQLFVSVATRVIHFQPPHHLSYHSLAEHHPHHLGEEGEQHQEHSQHDSATAAIQKEQRELLSRVENHLKVVDSSLFQAHVGLDFFGAMRFLPSPLFSSPSLSGATLSTSTLYQLLVSLHVPLGPPELL